MNYLAPNLVTYLEMHHSDFNLCCFYPPPLLCKTNVRTTAVESTGQLASVSLGNDDFFCLLKLYRIVFLKENGQNITNIMLKVFKKFNLTFI